MVETVLVDTREPEHMYNLVAAAADERGVNAEKQKLDHGDFRVGPFLVERKAASDFNSSITDGRLLDQSERIQKNSTTPILVLEGNPYTTDYGPQRSSVSGIQTSISVKRGIRIIFTDSMADTANVAAKLAEYAENDVEPV